MKPLYFKRLPTLALNEQTLCTQYHFSPVTKTDVRRKKAAELLINIENNINHIRMEVIIKRQGLVLNFANQVSLLFAIFQTANGQLFIHLKQDLLAAY